MRSGKGQLATFEVDGTFDRRPAPCDGLLIETSNSTILLPLTELVKAVRDLKKPENDMGTVPQRIAREEDLGR